MQVLCFGNQHERSASLSVTGVEAPVGLPAQDPRHAKFFASDCSQDLVMSGTLGAADVVHCHTWYRISRAAW